MHSLSQKTVRRSDRVTRLKYSAPTARWPARLTRCAESVFCSHAIYCTGEALGPSSSGARASADDSRDPSLSPLTKRRAVEAAGGRPKPHAVPTGVERHAHASAPGLGASGAADGATGAETRGRAPRKRSAGDFSHRAAHLSHSPGAAAAAAAAAIDVAAAAAAPITGNATALGASAAAPAAAAASAQQAGAFSGGPPGRSAVSASLGTIRKRGPADTDRKRAPGRAVVPPHAPKLASAPGSPAAAAVATAAPASAAAAAAAAPAAAAHAFHHSAASGSGVPGKAAAAAGLSAATGVGPGLPAPIEMSVWDSVEGMTRDNYDGRAGGPPPSVPHPALDDCLRWGNKPRSRAPLASVARH